MSTIDSIPLEKLPRKGGASWRLAVGLLENILRSRIQPGPDLRPFLFAWHCTWRCNFRCSYCHLVKKGWVHNTPEAELSTVDALRLLRILRAETRHLYISGGEPLVRPDIVEILREARKMGFKTISMVSNMSLIHRRMDVLEHLTHLVVSLDMLDHERYATVVGQSPNVVRRVRENIETCATLQKAHGFGMATNFVVTPETLPHVPAVLAYCRQLGIRFTLGPEVQEDGSVAPDLRDHPLWTSTLQDLIALGDHDPTLLDSRLYLETLRDFAPFRCHPLLAPRLDPMGELIYPCKPLDGVRVDVLAAGSWAGALRQGREAFGPPPRCTGRCYMNCFIAPSQFVSHPVASIGSTLTRRLFPRKLEASC